MTFFLYLFHLWTSRLDCWITGGVADVERIRQRIAPEAGLLCNEIYDGDGSGVSRGKMIPSASWNLAASWFGYVTFRLTFHHFDRFELDLREHTQAWGAALSCPRLKLADMVLI